MTDRELLEYAAKAAGVELQWESDGTIQNRMDRPTTPYYCQGLSSTIDWNPLNDDGDALRLAVKLNLWVEINDRCAWAQQNGDSILVVVSASSMVMHNETNKDPYAATRRAIVRAAAEIGRSME